MCTHNMSFHGEIRKNLYLMSSFLDLHIMNTYLYNIDHTPLKPHFYIVKVGFTEVYIIFLIYQSFFYLQIFSFGGEIFYIFE